MRTVRVSLKMSGTQYYWTISIGLIVGLILAVVIGLADGVQTNDPLIAVPIAAAFLYATVATFVVLLEIWDRFGLGAAVLAAIVAPAILVYWFSRIDGIPKDS
tara:strand:- start:566 stop:874 length:309 start_codon:yes stop_codon:yes gene_type:complete